MMVIRYFYGEAAPCSVPLPTLDAMKNLTLQLLQQSPYTENKLNLSYIKFSVCIFFVTYVLLLSLKAKDKFDQCANKTSPVPAL